ncbi:MAG TPA: hypothetical protein VH370_04975 [Humisphaera sp.]|jgi:enamine deaminase RidA (YjgF/YER057c/UK114 family)|nr:hypothetical protein [Humisphaera sp.]
MTVSSQQIFWVDLEPAILPNWVRKLLKEGGARAVEKNLPGSVTGLESSRSLSLASACICDVDALEPQSVEEKVAEAYRSLAAALKTTATPHPVRIWNYVPHIHRPTGEGVDRYMNFNAGRFKAFGECFGESEFARLVPSASAVGYDGRDLVIHALAADAPGRAVANPRQVAPYRYSRRFGPVPPCFARATVMQHARRGPLVLVGGTASIRGEDSIHLKDLTQQTAETLENLAWLIAAACGSTTIEPHEIPQWLSRFRELRVYYSRAADREAISALIAPAFAMVERIEMVRAELCRAELLVEIEGLAEGSGG